eukprot:1179429-Prorocentrum_minimum.AAC.1
MKTSCALLVLMASVAIVANAQDPTTAPTASTTSPTASPTTNITISPTASPTAMTHSPTATPQYIVHIFANTSCTGDARFMTDAQVASATACMNTTVYLAPNSTLQNHTTFGIRSVVNDTASLAVGANGTCATDSNAEVTCELGTCCAMTTDGFHFGVKVTCDNCAAPAAPTASTSAASVTSFTMFAAVSAAVAVMFAF